MGLRMTSPHDPRPANLAACHQRIGQLEAIVATREATIAAHEATNSELRQTIELLSADNALLKRELFGSRRERFVDDEPQLPPPADPSPAAPSTTETEPAPQLQEEPPPQQEKKKRTSSGRRRRKFPECLPREQRRFYLQPEDIPAEMRDNPRARRFFKKIGEILEVIPLQLKVVEQYQEVIVLDQDDERSAAVAASRPARLIKSFASPSLLAYLTVSRFADHLPYYRLEDITGRSGYRIERSTQWRWMRELSKGVTRLTDLMWRRIRQSAVLNVDETYVQELCGQGQTLTGYLWAGVGDAQHPYDCFAYTSSRRCAGPEEFLRGFQGYLVADAYIAYERIGELWPGVSKATCWIHARRGFEACHKLGPTRHTRRAMNFFQRLFDIEDRYRTADSAARHAARQAQSKPIVDEFHAWLEDVGKTRLPKDKLLGAIRYLLDRWPSFLRFLESGDIPLDNNAAERALKFPILGRKAWLFVGNAAAGHTAAKLFTLTKTCNRLHIDPFAYLQDVYARLPTTTDDDLERLLPDHWIAEHPQHLIPERVQEAHDRALRARERREQRRRCAA
jgi:transposase